MAPTDEEVEPLRVIRDVVWRPYEREGYRSVRGWIEYLAYDRVAQAFSIRRRLGNAQAFADRLKQP